MKTVSRKIRRRLDPTIYLDAAERIATEKNTYSCCAIWSAIEGKRSSEDGILEGSKEPEAIFYSIVFSIKGDACWFETLDDQYVPRFKRQDIRIMALCLAAALAEEQNKRKTSLF